MLRDEFGVSQGTGVAPFPVLFDREYSYCFSSSQMTILVMDLFALYGIQEHKSMHLPFSLLRLASSIHCIKSLGQNPAHLPYSS
jgi:hypothetical protein